MSYRKNRLLCYKYIYINLFIFLFRLNMIIKIDNIILLGTSHVAKKSAREIQEVIEEYNPEVVGIELDINRLKSLLSSSNEKNSKKNSYKMLREIGLSGYLFAIIAGYVQQKIGKSLGIQPGIDMKTAYLKARERNTPVSLIDINIKVTLKKMSRLSFFKKMNMFFSLFFKSFKKEYRNKLNFDVKKGVPDEKTIEFAMKLFKKEVPLLYKILIEDRNIYMSRKLLELKEKHNGYILAVVGAGHLEGMKEYIQKNIKSIQTPIIPSTTINLDSNKSTHNFSFSVNVEDNEIKNEKY